MRYKKASVLLFVMAMIFASSVILMSIAEYASIALRSRATASKEYDLRLDAYSALNATAAILNEYAEIDGGIYSVLQGWEKPFADGRISLPSGSQADVVVVDESGKIPLRNTSSSKLAKYLEALGLSETDSLKYSDLINDWIDSNDNADIRGAEYLDYDHNSALPPNRPMESFRELAFVKDAKDIFFDENGEPTELYRKFTSVFSLEPFKNINLNSASEEVLNVLMESEDKDYTQNLYLALRGKIGAVDNDILWCKNSADLRNRGVSEYPTQNAAFKAQFLKIFITIKRGLAQYNLVAYYTDATTYASMRKTSTNTSSRSSKSSSTSSASKQSFENGTINASASKKANKSGFKVVKIREFSR